MLSLRETVGAASVVAGAAVLAAVSHHPTDAGRLQRERAAVRAAADHITHQQIADAWMQARLGATAALTAIAAGVDLDYLSTHQDGDAIILTFQGRRGRCVDLVSQPDANTIRTRPC